MNLKLSPNGDHPCMLGLGQALGRISSAHETIETYKRLVQSVFVGKLAKHPAEGIFRIAEIKIIDGQVILYGYRHIPRRKKAGPRDFNFASMHTIGRMADMTAIAATIEELGPQTPAGEPNSHVSVHHPSHDSVTR